MVERTRAGGSHGAERLAAGLAEDPRPLIRATALGISASVTCGVRDYATLLTSALGEENVASSMLWLERREASLLGARSQIRSWTRELTGQLAENRPQIVLLHYSVFSYSYRGLPIFAPTILAAVRRADVPLVTVLHEYAYPWGYDGARGATWAVSQRAMLIDVMRASGAVLVTTESRSRWLVSRTWLAKRPVGVAPVFSNLPATTIARPTDAEAPSLGLFGYSFRAPMMAVVLDAVSQLRRRGVPLQLRLLGSPGRASSMAEEWLAAARRRDVAEALSFSGTLPAQGLSDALADCDLLLFGDIPGPTSRKTTLAASLASGRPVLALDGPERWVELDEAKAAEIVEPTAAALVAAIASLLDDERAREALGARGRAFAERSMSARRSARVLAGLMEEISA
jgi:glycosyltransferase involved in cell wall biosynthesis